MNIRSLKKRLFYLFSIINLLLLPLHCHAFFCPTNFQQINEGDSIETVTNKCGQPDEKKESYETNDNNTPQEWSYFAKPTTFGASSLNKQGTYKTIYTFDQSGQLINIINGAGVSVGSSSTCGKPIKLGDTRDQVKAACGSPAFLKQSNNQNAGQTAETKVVEFTYNGTPKTTLIFKDGKLDKKK